MQEVTSLVGIVATLPIGAASPEPSMRFSAMTYKTAVHRTCRDKAV